MPRLPQPGSDQGTWGNVLNDFLAVAHNADGTLKPNAVGNTALTNSSVSQSKLMASTATAGQVLSTDGTSLVWATPATSAGVSDASASVKGVLRLTGDLGGTAMSPTVPGLASKVDTSDVRLTNARTPLDGSVSQVKLSAGNPTSGQVLSSDGTSLVWTTQGASGSIADASTTSKGIIQLAGDLAGTAGAPTVPALANKIDTTDVRLSNARTPIDASVTPAKLDSLAQPTSGQYLSYNGTKLNWVAAPSGGSGGGAAYDGSQEKTVFADTPPAGLTAVAANGTTDDAPAIQAQLNYVKTTWGAGIVQLPPKTMKCLSTLTIPLGVILRGINRVYTVLDFSAAGASIVAITGSQGGSKPLDSLKLKGPNGGNKMTYPTNTSTGILFSGVNVTVRDVAIEGFFYGIDLTSTDTFFFCGENLTIGNAGVGIDMNQSASHNGGSAPTENGERMRLVNSVIYNSQLGFDANGSGVGFFADGCSFDYLGKHGRIADAFVFLTNCHLETGYAPTNNNNWGSTERYMFDMQYTGRLTLNACRLEVRDAGVYSAVTPFAGPSNYNSGFARFNDCTWYGNIPTGGARQYNSRDMIFFPSGTAATVTTYSPFATKWNTIQAYQVSTDAYTMTPGYEMYVTGADVSSNAGGTPTQAVTITRRPPAGETTHPQMWIVVQY